MSVLAVAQQKEGALAGVSFEAISAAQRAGDDLHTLVLAADATSMADQLAARGGGAVHAVSHPNLGAFHDEVAARAVVNVVQELKPTVVIGAATFYGKALFSRVAALLDAPMISEVTGISRDGSTVTFTRPTHGGKVVAEVVGRADGPVLATIRPKIFPESSEGAGSVTATDLPADLATPRATVKEVKVEAGDMITLGEADRIVSAGRGIKGPENVPLIENLAKAAKAAFGATRAIVDAGWVPYQHQVGQTGRTVNPKLYIACGVSGAIQHLVGMQGSQTIVAINKDQDAPIFKVATYGVVADLFDIVPVLTTKLEQELG